MTSVCVRVCTCVCARVCVCARTCVHACVHVHTCMWKGRAGVLLGGRPSGHSWHRKVGDAVKE